MRPTWRAFRSSGPRTAGKSGHVPEAAQRADEFLVVAPALNGTLIDLLPHLPNAGRRYGSLGLVEIQAPLIPRKPQKFEDPSGPFLLIEDQFRVRHVEQRPRRQYAAPVCNESLVIAVIVSQIR